jgi:hypothetical protein
VHLGGLLAHDELSVVRCRQFVQTEEAEVGKDLVQDGVVTVCTARITLEEDFGEDFEEFLVTYAAVEDLLHEHFLVGIFEL